MPKLDHTPNTRTEVSTNLPEDVPTAAEPTSTKSLSGKIIIRRRNVSLLGAS